MKKILLRVGSSGIALACGVLLAGLAILVAWELDDSSFGSSSGIGMLFVLFTFALAFGIPFFTCRPLGRMWWISSLITVCPTVWLLGGLIVSNLGMGKGSAAYSFQLVLIVIASVAGGFVGNKRITSNDNI